MKTDAEFQRAAPQEIGHFRDYFLKYGEERSTKTGETGSLCRGCSFKLNFERIESSGDSRNLTITCTSKTQTIGIESIGRARAHPDVHKLEVALKGIISSHTVLVYMFTQLLII